MALLKTFLALIFFLSTLSGLGACGSSETGGTEVPNPELQDPVQEPLSEDGEDLDGPEPDFEEPNGDSIPGNEDETETQEEFCKQTPEFPCP